MTTSTCQFCKREFVLPIDYKDKKCPRCGKEKKPTISLLERVHLLAMKVLFNAQEA
jgi:hypothetical protein